MDHYFSEIRFISFQLLKLRIQGYKNASEWSDIILRSDYNKKVAPAHKLFWYSNLWSIVYTHIIGRCAGVRWFFKFKTRSFLDKSYCLSLKTWTFFHLNQRVFHSNHWVFRLTDRIFQLNHIIFYSSHGVFHSKYVVFHLNHVFLLYKPRSFSFKLGLGTFRLF